MYHYTYTEDYIFNLYKSLSISKPDQLNIKRIATQLSLNIYFTNTTFRFNDNIFIKRSNKQREWQKFGHEIRHYFKHVGNQVKMYYLFQELQENEANHFSYHFCIPTFMLQELKELNVYEIMNLFNVEYEFATRRLEMYQNKLIYWRSYNENVNY